MDVMTFADLAALPQSHQIDPPKKDYASVQSGAIRDLVALVLLSYARTDAGRPPHEGDRT